MVMNRKWVLARRPDGAYDPALDTKLVSEEVNLDACPEDKVIVKVEMLSIDAFIRTLMDEEAYHGEGGMGLQVGDVIRSLGYGTIVAAGAKTGKTVGQKVIGTLSAQTLATVSVGGNLGVHPFMKMPFHRPESTLHLFGITTGVTAFVGMCRVLGAPSKRDVVVVSAAAGAVGSIAAQVAKSYGARVIGIAGGAAKCQFLTQDLKLDAAVDYKDGSRSLQQQLDELAPNGIDFYFDNVGGSTLDAVLERINPEGRIVICGAISQYSGNLNHGKVEGPRNYLKLAERGATMKGFNVMQYMSSIPGAMCQLAWLHYRGYIKIHEDVQEGIEGFPIALQKLFTGGHMGKMLCKVASEEEKQA